MQIDVKEDLSKLTTINQLSINRLFDKISWIISDAVEQAELAKDNVIELDLGFGLIIVLLEDNCIKYKFKPSKSLEENIIDTVVNGKNQLTFTIENTLVSKITNVYKDMF